MQGSLSRFKISRGRNEGRNQCDVFRHLPVHAGPGVVTVDVLRFCAFSLGQASGCRISKFRIHRTKERQTCRLCDGEVEIRHAGSVDRYDRQGGCVCVSLGLKASRRSR